MRNPLFFFVHGLMSWLLEIISSILFQVDINHNCWKLFFSNHWRRCSLFHITAAHTATLRSIKLQCFSWTCRWNRLICYQLQNLERG